MAAQAQTLGSVPANDVAQGPHTDGPFTLRDELGRISEEGTIKNGALEGEVRVYSRGRLAAKYGFQKGLREGDAIHYNEAGDMVAQGPYKSGLQHGEWQFLDSQGRVVRRALYQAGDLQGRAITFYPTGKPWEFCDYRDGLKHGELLRYSGEGKLLERQYYQAGRLIAPPKA